MYPLYIPPEYDLQETALRALRGQLEGRSIVTGDLNAHHMLWSNRRIYRKGRIVENWFGQDGSNIMKNGRPTHIQGVVKIIETPDFVIIIICNIYIFVD